jgi:FixJ family two-component response regulator
MDDTGSLTEPAIPRSLDPSQSAEQLLDMVRRALEDDRVKREHKIYVANLEAQVAKLTEQLRLLTRLERECGER